MTSRLSRRGLLAAAGILPLALYAVRARAAETTISIDNFTFSPASLNVKAGTTVTWTNHDDIPHSIVAKDGKFHSRALDTEDAYSFTFAEAGSFDYYCGLHPHMTGKIVVMP